MVRLTVHEVEAEIEAMDGQGLEVESRRTLSDLISILDSLQP